MEATAESSQARSLRGKKKSEQDEKQLGMQRPKGESLRHKEEHVEKP